MVRLRGMLADLGIETKENLLLAPYSSFRIGGRARLGCFPKSSDELVKALQLAIRTDTPYLVIGNASNVVFADAGFDGVVIFTGGCKHVEIRENRIFAEAGATLMSIALAAKEASLSGMEFAYGIPGTLGGAVFMNAGAFGGCMADVCVASAYFDAACGEIRCTEGSAQAFANRSSIYTHAPGFTVLRAELCLQAGVKDEIEARMRDFMTRRRTTQPLDLPSAGSVFKRPAGHFAGKLIEECGLKGRRIGGAEVSEKHAGFIVNRGGATAQDVKELVALIRACVRQETGVDLECEIRFL